LLILHIGTYISKQKRPNEKAQGSADKEEYGGKPRIGLVKSQCDGEDIPNYRGPAYQGRPDAVFVDAGNRETLYLIINQYFNILTFSLLSPYCP